MKNARERMDVLAAYREVGTYRGAAAICGTRHKTVKRIVDRHDAGGGLAGNSSCQSCDIELCLGASTTKRRLMHHYGGST